MEQVVFYNQVLWDQQHLHMELQDLHQKDILLVVEVEVMKDQEQLVQAVQVVGALVIKMLQDPEQLELLTQVVAEVDQVHLMLELLVVLV